MKLVHFLKNQAFKRYEKGELEPYGIVLKAEGRIIGTVGCRWDKKEENNMALGYALAYECKEKELWQRWLKFFSIMLS